MSDVTDRELAELDVAECLRLIAPGGIGRIAYSGRYGPTVYPVNYRLYQGMIVFRTAPDSPTDSDLRTGIPCAAVERVDLEGHPVLGAREGWSVLIQGSAHLMDSEPERAAVRAAGVEPWPTGDRDQFVRIMPSRITGRRVRRAG